MGQASEVVESIKLYRTMRKIKEQLHDVLMHKVQTRCVCACALCCQIQCQNVFHPHMSCFRATQSPGAQQPFRLHTNLMHTSTGTGTHIDAGQRCNKFNTLFNPLLVDTIIPNNCAVHRSCQKHTYV